MGLEEILKNIESDTKAKAKQIADSTEAEIDKINEQSLAEVEEYKKNARIKAENDAKQLMTRELSRANTEAKGVYQSAVNDYINDSMDSLNGTIDKYLEGPDYRKLLNKLAEMATRELGEGCTLMVQRRDAQKLKTTGVKVAEATEEFLGGLRATSEDGKLYVDYSIEKIIELLRDSIAVRLLEKIEEES